MTENQLKSVNPKNNSKLNCWSVISQNEIDNIINKTAKSQSKWCKLGLKFRISLIKELALNISQKSRDFSTIMADEMGKPLKQGMAEINKCVWLCDYYVENAEKFLNNKKIESEYSKSYVTYSPIGVVLGIMPWNFPFWQVFRFAIPSLIVGNGVLLKHASNVQGCANAIESCFEEAGFPSSIFQNLRLPSSLIAGVIENDKISGVALTGSARSGKSVAKKAGEFLKKTVLELGGNDAYLVFDDADIEIAVKSCVEGRLLNAGQSCISAKRLIVTKNNIKAFKKKLIKQLRLKIVGDPHNDVDMGPLVSLSARNEVHNMVEVSLKMGAKLDLGGKIPCSEGAYYPITVLSDVKPGMPVFEEEVFGPVFSIIEAIDNDHTVSLANDCKYGLGAAIFTSDIKNGEKIANEKLDVGLCFLNDYVKSDPKMPFGGVKMSGYGRELSSYGLMEFVNIKSIVVEDSS